MNKTNCIFIKYKFIFNNNIKHTSYVYQKVFRSIYGYNQNVTKNNNKIYNYFRKGILYNIPYIKPCKNGVIIPVGYENKLINYFNTGENPTHKWRTKGDWKVEYNINKIDIDSESVILCLENFINEYLIVNKNNTQSKLIDEITKINNNEIFDNNYIMYIINILEKIINLDWFKQNMNESSILKEINNNYLRINSNY